MASVLDAVLTTEDLLEFPEGDGVTRELIEGELRERPMTTRSPRHSTSLIRIGQLLVNWLDARDDLEGVIARGHRRRVLRRRRGRAAK